MLNRRTFLKTGPAALSLASGLSVLDPAFILFAETVAASEHTPNLISLPKRLAPIDLSGEPWQQKIRRVGQSNMTEHDPAVMSIEEWANYWHSAGADIVFPTTGIGNFLSAASQAAPTSGGDSHGSTFAAGIFSWRALAKAIP